MDICCIKDLGNSLSLGITIPVHSLYLQNKICQITTIFFTLEAHLYAGMVTRERVCVLVLKCEAYNAWRPVFVDMESVLRLG